MIYKECLRLNWKINVIWHFINSVINIKTVENNKYTINLVKFSDRSTF